jgi:hypothetical protein
LPAVFSREKSFGYALPVARHSASFWRRSAIRWFSSWAGVLVWSDILGSSINGIGARRAAAASKTLQSPEF